MSASTEEKKEAETARASALSGLYATAQARHHQIKTRFIIAVIGAVILGFAGDVRLAMSWLAAVAFSQFVDTRVWAPFLKSGRTAAPTRQEWFLLCGSSAQATIIYSLFPALLWFLWGVPGKMFAVLWLCGALLHVTMHMHHERRTFLSAFIPHSIYFLGLPIYALVTGDDPGRLGAAALFLAALLYLGHLAVAIKEHSAVSAGMRRARELAQERQAAAENANNAKSAFLANISHEIRTPMNGILGMATALEASAPSPEQLEKIKIIRESGDLLMAVLNDLLDFSKIEANRIEFEAAPFELKNVAKQVERLHEEQATRKGLTLNVVCEGDCETPRIGDAHRIVQVLHNLISNAIKFTANGVVRVRIRAPHKDDTISPVLIEVADSGIGISKEQAARIFEPFTQADVTTTRKYGGTGLGLSIAKGLIEAMGGVIGVRSTQGEGATFVIELPLSSAKEEAQARDDAVADISDIVLTGLKILAAEDNAVNQAVLKTFLAQNRHDVTFAGDGLQAVEAFKNEAFDLVLMDISMPVMDGAEAMRQIRFLERDRGAEKGVPIVAVSAHAIRQQVEEHLASGFDGYVTKPVNPKQLNGEIARVMASQEADASSVSVA